MGCDIHIFVEFFLNGQWTLMKYNRDTAMYERAILSFPKINEKEHENVFVNRLDGYYDSLQEQVDRNYRLFAFLANVRNTDNAISPLSKPRGFPLDHSKLINQYEELINQLEGIFIGYHSHTYFTTQELMEVEDWSSDLCATNFEKFLQKVHTQNPQSRLLICFDS